MPRNHAPIFNRESMPWARDVDRDLDEAHRLLRAVKTSLEAVSKKATSNASSTQRSTVSAGASFRRPGGAEYLQINGDQLGFAMSGRTQWLGHLDCQLDEAGRAIMFISAWDENGIRRSAYIGAEGVYFNGTLGTVSLRAPTSYFSEAVVERLRVRDQVILPKNQGAYREAADDYGPFTGGVINGASYNFSILFPVGVFTVPPVVVASTSQARLSVAVNTPVASTSGFTVTVANYSGANELNEFYINWHAVQMTATSASG